MSLEDRDLQVEIRMESLFLKRIRPKATHAMQYLGLD
jgi:hypothetical protein